MINMTNEERRQLVSSMVGNGYIEYATNMIDDQLKLSPMVCGIKFCGWYLTTTECDQNLATFVQTWDGELNVDVNGIVK